MQHIFHKIQHFRTVLNAYRREPPKILGRWKIETCHKKTDNKIDLSNEDHCGPCGQYLIQSQTKLKTNPNKIGIS